jgi:hypothetical protein
VAIGGEIGWWLWVVVVAVCVAVVVVAVVVALRMVLLLLLLLLVLLFLPPHHRSFHDLSSISPPSLFRLFPFLDHEIHAAFPRACTWKSIPIEMPLQDFFLNKFLPSLWKARASLSASGMRWMMKPPRPSRLYSSSRQL